MRTWSPGMALSGTVNVNEGPAPVAKGWVPLKREADHASEFPTPVAVTCSPGYKTVWGAGAVIWGAVRPVVRTTFTTLNESKSLAAPLAPWLVPEKTAHSVFPSALIHLLGN